MTINATEIKSTLDVLKAHDSQFHFQSVDDIKEFLERELVRLNREARAEEVLENLIDAFKYGYNEEIGYVVHLDTLAVVEGLKSVIRDLADSPIDFEVMKALCDR